MMRRKRPTCNSAGRVTAAQLLLSFLALSSSAVANDQNAQVVLGGSPIITPPMIAEPPQPAEHTFTLRHILHHGTYRHPGLHRRRDVIDADAQVWLEAEDGYEAEIIPPLKAKSSAQKIERLVDRRPMVVDPMVAEARSRGYVLAGMPSAWTLDDVSGPDVTDKGTVLTMALIASDAYVEKPSMPDWDDVGKPFNRSADFGWEKDGLRGHIFADETNSTVVIGLKGTSAAVFDGEGTTTNDKENDNLFFSCCCAQQGQWSWHQVCDCATGTYSCNNTCVTQALRGENRYYQAARELYSNVTEIYPDSNIWVVGHSLGGAVSSLLGLTYGLPVVTFEAVPEALAAGRLGLPVPPTGDPQYPQTREYTGTYHFGHTADPVYIGTCNGATASCSFAGYAMESACHTGYECTYDTVADKGWRVGIGTHKIRSVINDVIRKYDTVPKCKTTPECRDCGNWKMIDNDDVKFHNYHHIDVDVQDTRLVRLQGRDDDYYKQHGQYTNRHHDDSYHYLCHAGLVGLQGRVLVNYNGDKLYHTRLDRMQGQDDQLDIADVASHNLATAFAHIGITGYDRGRQQFCILWALGIHTG